MAHLSGGAGFAAETIRVRRTGELSHWPKGLFDVETELLGDLARARRHG
ncbi:hypothetical protein [Actinacidiphila oryziradicis]|nr:hypothetical protein [Actinacidiphila oryziradicis]